MSEIKHWREIHGYAELCADEAWQNAKQNKPEASPEELLEAADEYLWQHFDGCQHVIYTAMAWDVCYYAREDYSWTLEPGEDLFEELESGNTQGEDGSVLDTLITRLAFCILMALGRQYLDKLRDEAEAEAEPCEG